MTGPDDAAELVAAARAGDPGALEQLLRAHHDRLHALALRLLGDRSDAEDATQEALVAIVRGLPRFDERSRFSTWAYRITVNTCLDELRRRRRRPVRAVSELTDDDGRLPPTEGTDRRAAERLDVMAALAELPEGFRAAVVLRDLCDLDYADIAQVLDLPPGTVRSRIARGRAALAERLQGNQDEAARRRTEVP